MLHELCASSPFPDSSCLELRHRFDHGSLKDFLEVLTYKIEIKLKTYEKTSLA